MESINLAAEPESVGMARRFVLSRLVEHDLEPTVAVLLTSELVANVVRHAPTDFTIMVGFDPCVRIEVHDGEAATDAFRAIFAGPPTVTPESPGGRGLPLVRALATRFGLADEPGVWNGKIVWFELDPEDLTLAEGT